jgi:polysaccharide deacetylase 2 family uncharacterized protein YibQ
MRGSGWGSLAAFWVGILLVVGFGSAVLQSLGPPDQPARHVAAVTSPPAVPAPPPPQAVAPAPPAAAPTGPMAGRRTPGPIEDPDPALLEPAKAGGGAMLPRIDAGDRAPMSVYARGFDTTTLRPRVGLIMAGVGASDAGGAEMIRTLPGGITLAISPYVQKPARLLEAARISGHEYLLSLPMESFTDPANEAGDHALSPALSPAQNADRLDWSLSRFAGYAGVTDALGTLRGERFGGDAALMAPVLRTLAARGLFYVEARPVAPLPPGMWAVNVDLLVDEPAVRSEIDAKLSILESLAKLRGYALGLVGTPRPLTTDRVTEWANGLAAKGLALAPVSALVKLQAGHQPETTAAMGGVTK